MRRTTARVGRRGFAAAPTAVLAVVISGASFACGTAGSPFSDPDDVRVRIDVVNHNFQDATLHAVWQGRSRRLGTVTGASDATFILPWGVSLMLRIRIDLLAGPECTTRGIMVDPGDTIFLEIRSHLLDDPDCFR